MKNIIAISISILLISACGDNENGDSESFNIDYVGVWNLTFSGIYIGNDCSGGLMGLGDGSTDGSTFYTLYEDGTYLSTDSFFCSAPDNSNEPSCQGTWSSNNTGITLYSFFPTTYDLNETNGIRTMTSELKGEMTSNGETTATCSKSIFTQQ